MSTPLIVPAASLDRGTPVVAYCRVSEATQVSNGSLDVQKGAVLTEVHAAGLRLCALAYGAEYGQVSADRPHLRQAIDAARRHGAGIVAADLSRLLRSEAFDKVTNRLAEPTPAEIEALLELAAGIPFLATFADPALSPAELHSRAVKRGMRAKGNPGGRRSSIDHRIGELILADRRKGDPLRVIATRYRLSLASVQRFVSKWDRDRPMVRAAE